MSRIGIVGGGAAGALVAAQILRQASDATQIVIFEPREQLAEGSAYSTTDELHLLNVRASGMSALPDQPDHFRAWARAEPTEFVPRVRYANYLRDLLSESAVDSDSVVHVRDLAVSVTPRPNGVRVKAADGSSWEFDRAVLATGHRPPGIPAGIRVNPKALPYVSVDPWAPATSLPAGGHLAILGSGLTAIDAAMSLLTRDEDASVVMVSRNGLLPARHVPPAAPIPALLTVDDVAEGLPLDRALQAVRAAGDDWRLAIDSLRATTPDLWQALGPWRREQFARHLRRLWDVHRHRMAPSIADAIDRWRSEGRLEVVAAPIDSIDVSEGRVALRSADDQLWIADRVVVATGPNDSVTTCPLLGPLVEEGTLASGPLGWGVDVEPATLRPRDHRGNPWPQLHVIGPPTRGTLFESTAMPEIRQQAALIGQLVRV